MKNKILLLSLLLSCIAFVSINKNTSKYPKYFPNPIYEIENNQRTKFKIELGRVLFYDPILSKDNSISCASCHNPYNAFAHADHRLSHGINDKIGKRNAPVLFNLAWQKSFMWDGAINHIDVQALAPISHPEEMGENISNVLIKLNRHQSYKQLFYQAYGDSLINSERMLKSISQFLLSLISSNSKYDSMLLGKIQFTPQEQNGYRLFKLHCNACHREPLFSNFSFKNNGLCIDTSLNDLGRYKISLLPSDSFKFKVPTLRNIEFSYPYMHDGRFKNLTKVMNHYNSININDKMLSLELKSQINLSSNEKVDIIAFLKTLSDKKFLFDPKHAYPKKK
jgi:cytochrome c peroxidase